MTMITRRGPIQSFAILAATILIICIVGQSLAQPDDSADSSLESGDRPVARTPSTNRQSGRTTQPFVVTSTEPSRVESTSSEPARSPFALPLAAPQRSKPIRVAQSPQNTLQNLLRIQQRAPENHEKLSRAQGETPPENFESEPNEASANAPLDDALEHAIRNAVNRKKMQNPSPSDLTPGNGVVRIPVNRPDINVKANNGLVSIVVRNASLKDVVAMIGETLKLNVVCAEDVSGTLSISLARIPLDEAFNAITAASGTTWTTHNRIIYVTTLAAENNLAAEVQGRVFKVFELDYVMATDIAPVVAGMLSPAGQSFPITSAADENRKAREAIAVEDLGLSVKRVAARIAELDIPPRQVQIEVHVLEVELSKDNRHGVNLQHAFDLSGHNLNINTTGFANAASPQAFFAQLTGPDMSGLIEWLQTTADTKTLASPNITVLNKQSASIQVGQQLGFRVTTTTETATTESVETLDIGVLLEVTPQITRDNRILLHVRPEISSGQVNPNTGLPEEEITELETDVMLQHGKGIVIGGLIQEKDEENQNKIPWFGDLRHLGSLFGKKEVSKKRSEIIIALIPRVLPFGDDAQARHDEQWHKATAPLMHGALHREYRPWEPRFYDAKENPRPLPRLRQWRCGHWNAGGESCNQCGHDHKSEYTPTPAPLPPQPITQVPISHRRVQADAEPSNSVQQASHWQRTR